MFEISHISLAALFLAGVQTSAHCVLMCGVFNAAASPAAWWQLQAGRLAMYTLLGAIAGALGGWLVGILPVGPSAGVTRILLGLAVLGLAVLHWRGPGQGARCPARHRHGLPMLRGLTWGLMPCPMLYVALLAAAVAGGPGIGAALLLAFGLGTTPALAAQLWLLARPLAWCQAEPGRRAVLIGACGGLVVLSGLLVIPATGLICRP